MQLKYLAALIIAEFFSFGGGCGGRKFSILDFGNVTVLELTQYSQGENCLRTYFLNELGVEDGP